MANEQNLLPLSTNKAREIGEIGGIASGKARRERKKLKESLLLMLEDSDVQNAVCSALVKKALQGNLKAFELLRDSIGEKPAIEVTTDITATAGAIGDIEAYIQRRNEG